MIYIEHTGIAARDPEALAQWYIDTLDMKLLKKTGPATFFVGYDRGACVEIYPAKTEAAPMENNYVSGVTHLALYTDDFEALRARLLARGVQPAAEPVAREDLKLALMRDPEGNLFHITSRSGPIIAL